MHSPTFQLVQPAQPAQPAPSPTSESAKTKERSIQKLERPTTGCSQKKGSRALIWCRFCPSYSKGVAHRLLQRNLASQEQLRHENSTPVGISRRYSRGRPDEVMEQCQGQSRGGRGPPHKVVVVLASSPNSKRLTDAQLKVLLRFTK